MFSLLQVVFLTCYISLSTSGPVQRSDDTSPLETVVQSQGQLITEMKAEMAAMKTRMDAMQAEIDKHHQVVAFMAAVPSHQDLSHDPRVKFGTPSLNAGGGFHTPSTFIAPVSGLYVFILKVTGEQGPSGRYMGMAIMKEGQVIAETEINDDNDADRTSVQVIVQVRKGESVWVQKTAGEVHLIWGGGVVSTFGGLLVHAGDSF